MCDETAADSIYGLLSISEAAFVKAANALQLGPWDLLADIEQLPSLKLVFVLLQSGNSVSVDTSTDELLILQPYVASKPHSAFINR